MTPQDVIEISIYTKKNNNNNNNNKVPVPLYDACLIQILNLESSNNKLTNSKGQTKIRITEARAVSLRASKLELSV